MSMKKIKLVILKEPFRIDRLFSVFESFYPADKIFSKTKSNLKHIVTISWLYILCKVRLYYQYVSLVTLTLNALPRLERP